MLPGSFLYEKEPGYEDIYPTLFASAKPIVKMDSTKWCHRWSKD